MEGVGEFGWWGEGTARRRSSIGLKEIRCLVLCLQHRSSPKPASLFSLIKRHGTSESLFLFLRSAWKIQTPPRSARPYMQSRLRSRLPPLDTPHRLAPTRGLRLPFTISEMKSTWHNDGTHFEFTPPSRLNPIPVVLPKIYGETPRVPAKLQISSCSLYPGFRSSREPSRESPEHLGPFPNEQLHFLALPSSELVYAPPPPAAPDDSNPSFV